VRHRAGVGLVLGAVGVLALVLSLTALPWVSAGGDEATFSDIRDAFDALDDFGGVGGTPDPPDVTVPPVDGSLPGGGSMGDPVSPVPPPGVRRQEPPVGVPVTPPGAPDPGVPVSPGDIEPGPPPPAGLDSEYLEAYVMAVWLVVVAMAALAVVFATWVVPRSRGGRMATGFLMAGVLGLAVNAVDGEGTVGPRVAGALVLLLCLGAHGAAVYDLFGEDLAPDPAWGVWVGIGGLVLALLGCVMGTRTERVPALR
jgi:hypothetical protein